MKLEIVRQIRSALASDEDVDCRFLLVGLYMSGEYGGFSKQLAAQCCLSVYQSSTASNLNRLYSQHGTVTDAMR